MNLPIIIAFSYLAGSIPFGLLLGKCIGLDVRKVGSGNIGTTNVMRTGNKFLGILTLILDLGKGALPVHIAHEISIEFSVYAGFTAIIGHMFPIWLKFRGGKGIATFIGVLLVLNPFLGILFVSTWGLVFIISKISSLSALFSITLTPAYAFFISTPIITIFTIATGLLVIIKHTDNIKRLLRGDEK